MSVRHFSSARRLVTVTSVVVVTLALVSVAAWGLAGATVRWTGPAASPAADDGPRPGLWSGTTHTVHSRSTSLLGVSYVARGDYWFRVNGDGEVNGHAVVTYEPTFDVAKMNNAITYIKSVGSSALALLPFPAAVGALKDQSLASLSGIETTFDDPKPIRSGPIRGRLHNGKLSLSWAEEQPATIPFTANMIFVTRAEKVADGALPVAAPWKGTASVADQDAGYWQAEAAGEDTSSESEVTMSTDWNWTAHRVGD